MDRKRILQVFILVFLLAWAGLFFVHKIDLTTADLGRHLRNGEMVLKGEFDVLRTNFYSYTEPDFPVINHHWGSGVVFYLIEKAAGFRGLSLFYLLVSLIVFWLFFRIAEKESGFWPAALVSLLLIPLIAARTEIRPEIFSELFIAWFFWILWHWRKDKIKDQWLFVLPILEIFWVNLHIYFIFGPALIALFLLKRIKDKKLWLVLGLTVLAALFSPFGLKGVLYPFDIFRNYGYLIVENQSVWFLENLEIIQNPNLGLFKAAFAVLVLSFILVLIRQRKRFNPTYFVLAAVFSALGWLAIRNFALFGLFALPIISFNFQRIFGRRLPKAVLIFSGLAILLITFFTHQSRLPLKPGQFGFGLYRGNQRSIEFFREQNLKGPVFNNYDIGGYLIYGFSPEERVFTDNRPEAYSVSFFQEKYIPAQQDNARWRELEKEYGFKVIFFSHRDATPWGQNFLAERMKDESWIPAFADSFAIIFVKKK